MLRFLARRLLQFPLILAVIYLVTFLLAWVAPGSPFERSERKVSPGAIAALEREFHADTWYGFLAYYPVRALSGDLGPSYTYYGRLTVRQIIADALPISVTIGLVAVAIALVVGVVIGTLAAVRRGGPLDWLSLTVALVGVSLPSFVVAAGLLSIFAFRLQWFDLGGWGRPNQLVLPAVSLSLLPMAYVARLTRVSMIDVLGSDYVRTARAKGLSRSRVVFKHCLRNAILPVLSFIGPAAAATMVGSFVVETVFRIPGLGEFFVESVQKLDQPLILGTVMVYSVLLLSLNLLVDVAYTLVDPRIGVDS